MEWDRLISLKLWSYDSFANNYAFKPKARDTRRVVLLYRDPSQETAIPSDMFKSLLDQSVRATDIAVQTLTPEKFKHIKNFVTTHVPGTELISEGEADTVIIPVVNKIYPYDFVEQEVASFTQKNPITGENFEDQKKKEGDLHAFHEAFRQEKCRR